MRSFRPLLLALSPLPLWLSNCRTAVDWGAAAEGGAPEGSGGEIAAGATTAGMGGTGGAGSGGAGSGGAGHASSGEGGQEEVPASDAGAAGDATTGGEGGSVVAECTLECRRGTECVARRGERACEFPTPRAWLTFESPADSTVRAVRLGAGDEFAPEVLKTFASDHYTDEFVWSPSGRYFLFREVWPDNPYETFRTYDRWLWSYFGRGFPTEAQPLPNLPNSGQYGLPRWDEATDAMVIVNGQESYVVRFDGDRAESDVAVSSDESYDVSPCPGASALIYQSDQFYLVPVGASPETERVALGTFPSQSPDLSKIVAVRPGSTSGGEVLYTVDCKAGAMPQDLLEIAGEFRWFGFWPDNASLLLGKKQGEDTLLEFVSVEHPDQPLFSGNFMTFIPSWDDSLLLLESTSSEARYHVFELATREARPLAIDAGANVEWCGNYLLIHEFDREAQTSRTQVLDPRSSIEPRPLVPDTGDELGDGACDGSGEYFASVRYTSSEQSVELYRLATPGTPPLVYPLGPRIYIEITSFHADERGLIAALAGPESKIWWLPMPDGVPASGRELPSSRRPALQPGP